jgi:tripartite-type tricarboxylate transporter receptor subunit TctC
MKKNLFLVFFVVSLTFVCAGNEVSGQQAYPNKPIDLIVPYNPGGGSDLAARLLSTYFSKAFGVKLNVINKIGGAGTIGLQAALMAEPNGYTILMDTHGLGSMIAFYEGKYPIDWRKRTWIGRIITEPMIYITRIDSTWNNLREVAEFIKKNPKKLRFGASGLSGSGYAVGVQFFNAGNISVEELNVVMFQGAPEVIAALAGGHIDFAAQQYSQATGMVQGKRIRAIAVAGSKRLPLLPEVQTAEEQGYATLDIAGYQGIAGPPGLSKEVVNFWAEALKKASEDLAFVQQAENLKQTVAYLSPETYEQFVERQYQEYFKLSKKTK